MVTTMNKIVYLKVDKRVDLESSHCKKKICNRVVMVVNSQL